MCKFLQLIREVILFKKKKHKEDKCFLTCLNLSYLYSNSSYINHRIEERMIMNSENKTYSTLNHQLVQSIQSKRKRMTSVHYLYDSMSLQRIKNTKTKSKQGTNNKKERNGAKQRECQTLCLDDQSKQKCKATKNNRSPVFETRTRIFVTRRRVWTHRRRTSRRWNTVWWWNCRRCRCRRRLWRRGMSNRSRRRCYIMALRAGNRSHRRRGMSRRRMRRRRCCRRAGRPRWRNRRSGRIRR